MCMNKKENTSEYKTSLLEQLQYRVTEKIIEKSNADLLSKLIINAETDDEADKIFQLGNMWKRTGLFYDVRLEELKGNEIKYLKKNEELSFDQGGIHHKLIIGDNYDALQNLLVQYKGQIDVIYIDPPYGSNNMGEFAETNYNNNITRDNLLSMLEPRLRLAKDLLSEDGVILCSIDDKNHSYIKCLMDNIFRETNFVATIPWRKRTAKSDVPFGVSQDYEWILIYAKSELFKASVKGKERRYYETPDFPGRPWRIHDMTKQTTALERPNSFFTMINPKTGEEYPANPNRTWRITKDTFKKYYENNEIIFPGDYDFLNISKPVARYFKDKDIEKDGENFGYVAMSTKLPEEVGMSQDGTKEMKQIFSGDIPFSFPKNSNLMKHLIEACSTKDSIVLDFFAGSGTTGHGVLKLNKEDGGERQFIVCTNNEITAANPSGVALDVTSKRLKRIMTGECYDGTNDFEWLENNDPYGDSLDVYDIESVSATEQEEGKTPFDVIDEECYGLKFDNTQDKIKWVCENFEKTQKYLEEKE